MTEPDLPLITVRAGMWAAELFDPRPSGKALGHRYVHGGYVRRLVRGDRCLTGRPKPAWGPNEGEGMPESFEVPLGFARAIAGEEFICIGAGRLRSKGRGHDRPELSTAVAWEVVEQNASSITMRCRDAIRQDGHTYAYELTRTVIVRDDGLDSVTTLHMDILWSHPVEWYPHPFFAHTGANRTAFTLPGDPVVTTGPPNLAGPAVRDAQGVWRLPATESLTNFVGLWGEKGTVVVHLDPALGGGRVGVTLDCPLDHIVVWASDHVASPEPKIIRAFKNGETVTWTLQYRWLA